MSRITGSSKKLRKKNPRIIYCGIVGFASGGRYEDQPAYDTIIQGSAGVSALFHGATGEPRYFPIVIADRTAGAIAVQMLLLALIHRDRTGEGACIQVPLFENMAKYVLEEHMY